MVVNVNLRLKPDDVAEQLALIALLIAHLPRLVDNINTHHPLVHCEVDFTRKVVNVLDKGAHDGAQTGVCLGTHAVDDLAGEFLAQSAIVLC